MGEILGGSKLCKNQNHVWKSSLEHAVLTNSYKFLYQQYQTLVIWKVDKITIILSPNEKHKQSDVM